MVKTKKNIIIKMIMIKLHKILNKLVGLIALKDFSFVIMSLSFSKNINKGLNFFLKP